MDDLVRIKGKKLVYLLDMLWLSISNGLAVFAQLDLQNFKLHTYTIKAAITTNLCLMSRRKEEAIACPSKIQTERRRKCTHRIPPALERGGGGNTELY